MAVSGNCTSVTNSATLTVLTNTTASPLVSLTNCPGGTATFTVQSTEELVAHWETGSGRINDLKGFSDACLKHGVMGIVDAASSLGVADFSINDYPGVVAWASCPQKGVLSLPLTYAPVSFKRAL